MQKTWIKAIAILEMVGGVVGILFCIYGSVASGFAFNVMVVIPVSFGIFILSLIAGIYLWKGREFGRKASIVVQFIQLPKFASPAFTFMFSFGFDLFAHLTLSNGFSNLGIQFRFLADGQLFLMTEGTPILLGISIPAIIALIKLQNYRVEETMLTDEQGPPSPDEYFKEDGKITNN